MITFKLNPKREKLPQNRHPWIFSGAIYSSDGEAENGAVVRVVDANNTFIAYGHYSRDSKLMIRLLEWDENCPIDHAWWCKRLADAFETRKPILEAPEKTTAIRLVFGENDFLPGLIIDKFSDYLVIQCGTIGMAKARDAIVKAAQKVHLELFGPLKGIVERSDSDGCQREGLEERTGVIWGEVPQDEPICIYENGLRFHVDLLDGQKTGFYTDQRENRQLILPWLKGRRIADVCCYTGAFSTYALNAGAKSAMLVDVSQQALEQATNNLRANGLTNFEVCHDNAFSFLRSIRKKGEKPYDAIILDPPKLVPTRHDMVNGLRGYKDLNFQAISILPPGGILATFSCSGLVSMEQFREAVVYAAKDACKQIRILRFLHQASCHPIRFSFPEGEYLKGLLIQVCD